MLPIIYLSNLQMTTAQKVCCSAQDLDSIRNRRISSDALLVTQRPMIERFKWRVWLWSVACSLQIYSLNFCSFLHQPQTFLCILPNFSLHPPELSSFSTKSILPVLYSSVKFIFLGFTNVHTNWSTPAHPPTHQPTHLLTSPSGQPSHLPSSSPSHPAHKSTHPLLQSHLCPARPSPAPHPTLSTFHPASIPPCLLPVPCQRKMLFVKSRVQSRLLAGQTTLCCCSWHLLRCVCPTPPLLSLHHREKMDNHNASDPKQASWNLGQYCLMHFVLQHLVTKLACVQVYKTLQLTYH